MHQDSKKLMSHPGQACTHGGAGGVSNAIANPMRYTP